MISALSVAVLSHRVSATASYVDRLSQLKAEYNSTQFVGGLDSNGQPVPISEASSMTYTLCKSSCGTFRETFSPPVFLQEFSAWLLPYLALASQLPFGARYRQDNLTSILLTIGSPMLAIYSLILTLLISRWIHRKFETISYPNKDLAVRVLINLQQVPLRVTSEDSLLASLIVLPENNEWWSELTQLLDFRPTWSISSVIDLRADTAVVGWRLFSPKSDHIRVTKALSCANLIAFVASTNGAVKASSRSRQRAISVDVLYQGSLFFADENRSPPVFNYAPVNSNNMTRSRWAPGIFTRMCISSLMPLLLQWGTIAAALAGIIYTPPTGLGCRSLGYLLYGVVSTLVWLLLVVSGVFAHYASHRPKTTSSRITIHISEGLCWIGKVTAILNGIWGNVSLHGNSFFEKSTGHDEEGTDRRFSLQYNTDLVSSLTTTNNWAYQTEQAAEMVNLNIKAIAVHSDSVQAAQADGRDLLDEPRYMAEDTEDTVWRKEYRIQLLGQSSISILERPALIISSVPSKYDKDTVHR
ncbi:hypothetical protein SERLA73DRAFT_164376 [Serpula lacrymans var. lacrymans S7.3]|uniref:Uncharacterized protein n=1 Tax=Serpula lacrymans var. lacrymans (strain S7.3) TaxID=936435 RepID=F8QIU5_SERL3|nr:hypothetical protein SERLA73DRAFT_164376 [Serpula lacrymans var. lacrymans S7.3]